MFVMYIINWVYLVVNYYVKICKEGIWFIIGNVWIIVLFVVVVLFIKDVYYVNRKKLNYKGIIIKIFLFYFIENECRSLIYD